MLIAAIAASPVQAQQAGSPGVVFAEVVKAQATVADVNKADRMVTLRTDDGREVALKAGPEVRNFDQIQKGDKITAEYHEATAIFVRKPEAPAGATGAAQQPSAGQGDVLAVAAPGEKPAGVVANVTEITAKVEDIDYGKRLVTLRGPQGNVRTIKLGDRVQNIQGIAKGDDVVIRHTEAVAIAVTKS
jgi:hypothetical protein